MFAKFAIDLLWALVVLFHASLFLRNRPDQWYKYSVPLALHVIFASGRVRPEENRVRWRKFPGQILLVVAILTFVDVCEEFRVNFYTQDLGLVMYLYVRFAFWGFLSLYATEVSQILIPIFFMVRPVYGLFTVLYVIYVRGS